jgi:two-component system response regulator RegX3
MTAAPLPSAAPRPVILLVEDEYSIGQLVRSYLERSGYRVVWVTSGEDALSELPRHPVKLVILDVGLPGIDGFDVCRRMRAQTSTPIVMLTARDEEPDRVVGLELGADDYVTKPYNPRELRARVRAVLRRTSPDDPDVVRFGVVEVDLGRCEVRRQGTHVDLSATEFKLLGAFVRSQGRVLSREQLLDAVWGAGVAISDRVVDNHIVSLRRKVEADATKPQHIVNIRGLGYRFDA